MSFLKLPSPIVALLNRISNRSISTLTISKINSAESPQQSITELRDHLVRLDQQITETQQNLIAAQAVSIRAQFGGNNGFLSNFKSRKHFSDAQQSAQWHLTYLQQLIKKRFRLTNKLYRLTGQLWPKRLRFLFSLICFILIGLAGIGLLFMSLIAAIYVLPIFGLIFYLYYIIKKRTGNLPIR